MVKDYFDQANLEFVEVDCDQNLEEAIAVMKMAGSEVLPIIRYGEDNFILGYQPDNLEKLVKLLRSSSKGTA